MNILAMETSGLSASAATLEDEELLFQRRLPDNTRSAQGLAPAIDAVLLETGWSTAQLDLVAITAGPGSFTGLRVGVVTAKTIAYATDCKLRGINTLTAIAEQASPAKLVWTVLDAQRGQLFVASYTSGTDDRRQIRDSTALVDRDKWIADLTPGCHVSGPGLSKVQSRLPDTVQVEPTERWWPMAATVGRLAYLDAQNQVFDDLWKLLPQYRRRSAAEEKLDGR